MSRVLDWLSCLVRAPLFVIRVRGGTPTASRGVVTTRFLAACGDVLRSHGIPSCTIRGFRSRDDVSLHFSREVPEAARQGVRNVWPLYR